MDYFTYAVFIRPEGPLWFAGGNDHRGLLARRPPWLAGRSTTTLDDIFRIDPRAWIMGRYRSFAANKGAGIPATTLLDVASDYYAATIGAKTTDPESSPLYKCALAKYAAFELCLKKQFPEGAIHIIDMGFSLRVPSLGPDKFQRLLKLPDSRILSVR